MSCGPVVDSIALVGTIVACGTRFDTPHGRAIAVGFQANWVVVFEVEEANAGAPFAAGEQAAVRFHSPTHLFRRDAHEVVGLRYRFTLERTTTDRVQWTDLTAARIE